MQEAEDGAVSYSGAISAGEKQVVRAIREAGLPVVVVLNDGFPASGSEHERFFKPGECILRLALPDVFCC